MQDGNDQSYGPKLDGRTTGCTFTPGTHTYDSQPCMQFTGAGPWIAHPDNVYSFFKTGITSNAYGSLNGGIDAAAARLSVGAENTKGYIPNEMLRKFTTQISGTLDLNNRLTTNASLYVRQELGHGPAGRRLQPGHPRAVHLVRPPGRHERAAQRSTTSSGICTTGTTTITTTRTTCSTRTR